jgi:glycosyltransferase involved in cell wall biosynthesis
MAAFNYSRYIGKAIESVLAQTYPRLELCICDDGSTDGSDEIIRRYARHDVRIRWLSQQNAGMGAALNAAWELSAGEIIALLDADDLFHPTKLATTVAKFITAPNAGIVAHEMTLIGDDGRTIRMRFPKRIDEGWLAPVIFDGGSHTLPPCSGLTLRREVASRVFPCDPHFRACADGLLRDRAIALTEVAVVREPLSSYRLHGSNLTGLSGPTDIPSIEKTFAKLAEFWADRRAFALSEHGLTVPPGLWDVAEATEYHLAKVLLEGRPSNPELLKQVNGTWRSWLWRLILAAPRPLGRRMLRMWWTDSRWKASCVAFREAISDRFRARARPNDGLRIY